MNDLLYHYGRQVEETPPRCFFLVVEIGKKKSKEERRTKGKDASGCAFEHDVEKNKKDGG